MSSISPSQQQLNLELRRAASDGDIDETRKALVSGAHLNGQDVDGHTALHLACIRNQPALVRFLLDNKANINILNKYNYTPLHWACTSGSLPCAQQVVEAGCDTEIRNDKGEIAMEIAARNGHTDIVNYLSTHSKNQQEIDMFNSAIKSKGKHPQPDPLQQDAFQVDPLQPNFLQQDSFHQDPLQNDPPQLSPLLHLQHDSLYGTGIVFDCSSSTLGFTSEVSSIDFENGVQLSSPKNANPASKMITFQVKPAFASHKVFVLPDGIEAASPTFFISTSSGIISDKVTLTIEHWVNTEREDEAKNLVFLVADSKPCKEYHFKVVDVGEPVFKIGERSGSISTDRFSFWIVGIIKRLWNQMTARCYTVRLYKSPDHSHRRVAIIFISILHSVYINHLDRIVIPRKYPEVSTHDIDKIVEEPVYITGDEVIVERSETCDCTVELDKTSISKSNMDLPRLSSVDPWEIDSYPPKIVCRFTPLAQDIQRTSCTLTIHGFSRPVTFNITLHSSMHNSQPSCPTIIEPPRISSQPDGVLEVTEGKDITLTVLAEGSIPLSYQWTKDGEKLLDSIHYDGSSTGCLLVKQAHVKLRGHYVCAVSNRERSITTDQSRLMIGNLMFSEDFNCEEIVIYLEQNGITGNDLKVFQDQNINGEIFLTLPPDRDDLKQLDPTLTYGGRTILQKLIKKAKCQRDVPEIPSELPVIEATSATPISSSRCLDQDSVDDTTKRGPTLNNFGLTDEQLGRLIGEADLFYLAKCFGAWTMYTENPGLQLTQGEQHTIAADPNQVNNRMKMKEALKIWRNRDPFSATFRNLILMLLELEQSNVAVEISQYIKTMSPSATSAPRMSTRATSTAETSTPEKSTRATTTPRMSTRATSTPETSTPEVSTSAISPPVTSTQATTTPATSTPETSTPVMTTPKMSTRATSTSETSTSAMSSTAISPPATSTQAITTPATSTPETYLATSIPQGVDQPPKKCCLI